MNRYQHLEARIEALEETIRELTGKPRGPITYQEAENAWRNGDGGRMLAKYIEQIRKGGMQASCGHAPVQRAAEDSVQRGEGSSSPHN